MATDKTRTLKLANITADDKIQPRAQGLNEEHVARLIESIEKDEAIPPLVVYQNEAGSLILSEGFHRVEAFERAGVRHAECVVRKGEWSDALANACGSNKGHGLPRTNEDKRRAVGLMLAEFPDWTDHRIAEAVRVGHPLVADVRSSVGISSNSTRTGKDGKKYPVRQKAVGVSASTDDETPGENADSDPETDEIPPADDDADEGIAYVETVNKLCYDMDQIGQRIRALKESPLNYSMHCDASAEQVKAARNTLWGGRPLHVCPHCNAEPLEEAIAKRCPCRGTGRVKQSTFDRYEREQK